MLNCEETSRLVSEGLDRDLSLAERLSLKFHLSMCAACRNLKRQMNILRQVTSFYTQADLELPKNPKKGDLDADEDVR